MTKTFLILVLVSCLVATMPAQTAANEILPAGTLLRCTVEEPNFSSRTAQIDEPVLCSLGAVTEFGHSVFPWGAYLGARLDKYRDPGHFFGKGWMHLEFDHMILPGGVAIPLSAKVISVSHQRVSREGKIEGRGHAKRDLEEWAIPILWPEKVLTLPARGPRPTLKGETRITLRLLEDVEVPATTYASRTPSSTLQIPRLRPRGGSTPSRQPLHAGSATPSLSSATAAPMRPNTTQSSPFFQDASVPRLTWLILKDGTSYLARDYWVEGGKLQCVTLDGERRLLPLSRLDLGETVRLNKERNVEFVIRSGDSGQSEN